MWGKRIKFVAWTLAFFLSLVFAASVHAKLSAQDIEKLRSELEAQGSNFYGWNKLSNRTRFE